MEPDERTLAQVRIEVLTSLVSEMMNRLVYWQTTARAMSLSREREQQPAQGGPAA